MTFALDKVGKMMRYQIVTGPISYRTLSWMHIDRTMITIPQLMDWINWYQYTNPGPGDVIIHPQVICAKLVDVP